MAIEKVHERLIRSTTALDRDGLTYAVIESGLPGDVCARLLELKANPEERLG